MMYARNSQAPLHLRSTYFRLSAGNDFITSLHLFQHVSLSTLASIYFLEPANKATERRFKPCPDGFVSSSIFAL
jgi:hypothetical protein